ncbi:MAG: TetR family transcriptional regulator [Propionibacteriales bacterium]|nr:TetR family transcriptional regulator [Propionibacteriales bacterium]
MSASHDNGSEVLGTVELLWGLRVAPARGPKPALSVDRIASTAMTIADIEGLSAVSMQRVAGELDFTKMSLYRYVAGKAELVAAMIELAVDDPPDLDAVPGGWRAKIEEWARLLGNTWRLHPWLPWVTMGDRVMGPREVGWIESAVGVLAPTGLDRQEQMDAVLLLCGHIRNTQSTATAGTQPWDTEQQLELLRDHGDRFPALTAVASDRSGSSPDNGREFGLRCILDGLELRIADLVGPKKRARATRRTSSPRRRAPG